MSVKQYQHTVPDGRCRASGSGGGIGRSPLDDLAKLTTPESQAAYADKWIRLTCYQMSRMWEPFYKLLDLVRTQELYKQSRFMEGGKTYESFEAYWDEVLKPAFGTWAVLESKYGFLRR